MQLSSRQLLNQIVYPNLQVRGCQSYGSLNLLGTKSSSIDLLNPRRKEQGSKAESHSLILTSLTSARDLLGSFV